MTIAEKITRAKTDYDAVYEAGKNELLSLHPEKTVSGSYLTLDDVSELPHDVKCKVTGVDNPESVTVTRCGANLLNPDNFSGGEFVEYNGAPCYKYLDNATNFTYEGCFKENTQYTISFKAYLEATGAEVKIYYTDGTSSLIYVKNNTEHLATSTANKTIARIKGTHGYAAGVYIDLSYSRINEGTIALPYEPYNGQTLTPSADGTVEGMTSTYPQMNIFTDNVDAMLDVTYRQSKGMQTEYDRFWDAFQQNGNRKNYSYAFYLWEGGAYNPKYPITVVSNNTFNTVYCYSSITDTKVDIQLTTPARLGDSFYQATKMVTIRKIIIDEGVAITGSCFGGCSSLKNITFEGTIGVSINLKDSPLTKASITNVIEHLSSTATGQTATFQKSAKEAAFTADEWAALIADKTNWTFSLI